MQVPEPLNPRQKKRKRHHREMAWRYKLGLFFIAMLVFPFIYDYSQRPENYKCVKFLRSESALKKAECMTKNNKIPLLRDGLGPRVYKGQESELAEKMFTRFVEEGFRYDDISNHPDYPVYASAELLIVILPKMIDEMLKRKDTNNFLIYPMISSVDPEKKTDAFDKGRIDKLLLLADKDFSLAVCRFLEAIKESPPNSEEQVDRLLSFWLLKAER